MVFTPTETQEFEVRGVGRLKGSKNQFLECKTDIGVVAFWAGSVSSANVDALQRRSPPFRVRCGCRRPSARFARAHAFWVPEMAEIQFLEDVQERYQSAHPPKDGASKTSNAVNNSELTLYVVNCTKKKIWESDTEAPRFVPAQHAYRGQTVLEWLESEECARAERWLFLSAKYGFIEPDHPIGDYDVAFSDASLGPAPNCYLAAQVRFQRRWKDSMPLRTFRRVYVWSESSTYEHKVRGAFESTGATVTRLSELTPISANQQTTPEVTLTIQHERVAPLGKALGALPIDVYEAIDRGEPEWHIMEAFAAADSPSAILAALAMALSDYQLGPGGAKQYWQDVNEILSHEGVPRTIKEVGDFMTRVLSCPVSARFRDKKETRVSRLLRSDLPAFLKGRSIVGLGRDPMALWHALASAMRQDLHAKTVVFAIKVFDLMHRIATNRYLDFPSRVPIVADLRIARVSLSSGLLSAPNDQQVKEALVQAGKYASKYTAEIIEAWARVSEGAGGLSLFRIDSLVWQVAEGIYKHRGNPPEAMSKTRKMLEGYGASPEAADLVAHELTFAP
ncbi:MAG: N-glycosylase/DNA lyase [Verrucomicrobiales bacterium]